MKLAELNDWLTLLANIGVVIGIYALIAELNQNERLAQVDAYKLRMTERQESRVDLALSENLADLLEKSETFGPESLTRSEFIRVQAWWRSNQLRLQAQYYQYQQGFLDRSFVDQMIADIVSYTYQDWEAYNLVIGIEIPEFIEEIEQERRERGLLN